MLPMLLGPFWVEPRTIFFHARNFLIEKYLCIITPVKALVALTNMIVKNPALVIEWAWQFNAY